MKWYLTQICLQVCAFDIMQTFIQTNPLKVSTESENKGLNRALISNTLAVLKMGLRAPIPVYYDNINICTVYEKAVTCIITSLTICDIFPHVQNICLYTYKHFFRSQRFINGHLNIVH